MKTLPTALLASTFLCLTYAAAPALVHAGKVPWPTTASIEPTRAEKQTNDDTDLAIDVARHGLPVRPEVEAMRDSVDTEVLTHFGIPDACVIQAQLTEELGDLYERARNFRAHEEELRQAQFQVVLGRYELAVLEVQERWKSGNLAEDVAIKTMATMRVDAFDYLQGLGVVEIRTRLNEAIAELIARGADATDRAHAAEDMFRKLYRLRLEAALAVFKARIAGGDLTRLDYQRIEKAVRVLEELSISGKPYACGA